MALDVDSGEDELVIQQLPSVIEAEERYRAAVETYGIGSGEVLLAYWTHLAALVREDEEKKQREAA